MWYRDYALVQQRVEDLERESRSAAIRAWLTGTVDGTDRARRSRVRAAAAAGVRRLGQSIVRWSDRIDACAAEADVRGSRPKRAFR